MGRAMGIDACKAGWVVVETTLDDFTTARAYVLPEIASLATRPDDTVVIDIPIGLPQTSRSCDALARKFLGPRRSSVFAVPCRDAIDADTHEKANAINRERAQSGLSAQSFGIFAKIRQVDTAMRAGRSFREGHPEMSFRLLSGRELAAKSSARGVFERINLISALGCKPCDLSQDLSPKVTVDDLLDACVLAWTAQRVAKNSHSSFPEVPEIDAFNLPMQMVA